MAEPTEAKNGKLSDEEILKFFQSQGVDVSKAKGKPAPWEDDPDNPPSPESITWGKISKMTPSEIEEDFPRIPPGHDFLLQVAPDLLDKQALLSQIYGKSNVQYNTDQDLFIVRKLDKSGKPTFLRTDEKGLTWADAGDVFRGVGAVTPELAASIATWSKMAQRAPGLPQTKLGLLGITAASTAAGEVAGAGKDFLFRKYGIKTDPRTGEILGRRALNTTIGAGAGYGVGRLIGGGRFTKKELGDLEALQALDPSLTVGADDLIALEGKKAAQALGIEQTGASKTLKPPSVRGESHAVTAAERVPGATSPMRKFELSREQGGARVRDTLTRGTDYDAMGSNVRQALREGEEGIRHWSQRTAADAASEAEAAVFKAGITRPAAGRSSTDAGTQTRELLSKRAQEAADEVSAMYSKVENELTESGVGQFVDFKGLSNAIKEWRSAHSPKVTKTTVNEIPESPLIGPSGRPLSPKQVIESTERIPVGEFGEADKSAQQWLDIAGESQTLSEAQTMISRLGELVRAGSHDVGSVGFSKSALNKFYRAAKADLGDSFDTLAKSGKVDAKTSTMWAAANKAHALKVDALNRSKLIQSALRTGREGGQEVDPRKLLQQLYSGSGKTGDLRLLRELLKDDFKQVQKTIIDDLVGSETHKIANTTGNPLRLSSGKVVTQEETLEVVNLSVLRNKMRELDDDFLKVLFNDPSGKNIIKPLRDALDEYDGIMKIHGSIGKSAGIETGQLDDFIRQLNAGNPSGARELMRNALKAERARRQTYIDSLKKIWRDGDFRMVEVSPEQFVDDVILAGDGAGMQFASTIFNRLPKPTQDEVRRHVADRIIGKTIDVVGTPIPLLKSGKGGKVDPAKFVREIYGTPARQRLIRTLFPKKDQETLDNFGKVMQSWARYKQIAGSAGKMSTETAIGTRNITSMVGQYAGSKLVFSKPFQAFISHGADNPKTLGLLFRIINRDPLKPMSKKSGAIALALGKTGSGTVNEVFELSEMLFEAELAARGQMSEEEAKQLGGFTSPSHEEIKDYLERHKKGQ